MMEYPMSEEEKIIKDIRNLFTLKKPKMTLQLNITINFISSKDDNEEERAMHSKSANTEIMISDEADEVIKKLFDSLKNSFT